MGNLVDNKFPWVIQNFNSLQTEIIDSDEFAVGGCKWYLTVYPKGRNSDYFTVFLTVAKHGSLPCRWRRHAKVSFTLVNQLSEKLSEKEETQHWFDENSLSWGLLDMLLLTKLHKRDNGFMVNRELKITAEVDVLEVIGKLDAREEVEETTQPLKKRKLDNDGVLSSDLLNS